jgi:1-acyl-sn-glycerol-3-phosphate acyltransferase
MLQKPAHLLFGLYAYIAFLVIIFLITCPLIIVLPTLSLRRAAGRTGVRLAMAAIGSPLRISGLENLPPGPCLVVANHASYMDGLVLTAALPARFGFVVQDGAASWPYVGLVLRGMGAIFVNRSSAREGARQTRELIRRLHDGESLAVFPEGTFRAEPGLMAFRKGAFLMAAKAGVPVVPAAIRGTRQLLGEGQVILRHSRVSIQIFAPLSPAGDDRDAVETLRDQARQVIQAHCGEPDGRSGGAHRGIAVDEPE